jgi:hypothetical protein
MVKSAVAYASFRIPFLLLGWKTMGVMEPTCPANKSCYLLFRNKICAGRSGQA